MRRPGRACVEKSLHILFFFSDHDRFTIGCSTLDSSEIKDVDLRVQTWENCRH